MTIEYTKEDDMQTLRLWYNTKPFTKELETEIRDIPTTAFSDDTLEDYIQERLKENNGEYDKPLPKEELTLDELALNDDTKVEETKETIQQDTATQEVDETNEWNP